MECWVGIIIWQDYLSIMLVHCHYLRLLLAVDKECPEESEEERNSCKKTSAGDDSLGALGTRYLPHPMDTQCLSFKLPTLKDACTFRNR